METKPHLPSIPLPSDTVDIHGTPVTVRALSRAEALRLSTQFSREKADEAEAYMLACGTGVTVEEAAEWLASIDTDTGGVLIDRIAELSGIKPEIDKDGRLVDPKTAGSGRSRKGR